jgi:hypothetical protein
VIAAFFTSRERAPALYHGRFVEWQKNRMSNDEIQGSSSMDRWDLLIIFAAGYVAVTTLVRLMAGRRNQLVDQVRSQLQQQRTKKPKEPDQTDRRDVA